MNSGQDQWVIHGRERRAICKACQCCVRKEGKGRRISTYYTCWGTHTLHKVTQKGLTPSWQAADRGTVARAERAPVRSTLCFFEPLAGITSSKPHRNKNKTKQTDASRVPFIPLRILIPGNSIWGTHCESNNQGLGFPWEEGCFSREERDSPHPEGTHTSSDAPLLPGRPLLLSFHVTQPFFLKVPRVFFKESTPNKNLCHFPPKPSHLKNKTKQ